MIALKTIVKAIKLLSNPLVIDRLYQELTETGKKPLSYSQKLSVADLYHHKHYMVQVMS